MKAKIIIPILLILLIPIVSAYFSGEVTKYVSEDDCEKLVEENELNKNPEHIGIYIIILLTLIFVLIAVGGFMIIYIYKFEKELKDETRKS